MARPLPLSWRHDEDGLIAGGPRGDAGPPRGNRRTRENPRTYRAGRDRAGLTCNLPSGSSAQVIETREAESNPSSVLFRSTLYGAGTGFVLGGAYALVDGDDPSTGELLRWGTAIGAGAGLLIGLVYVASRADAAEDGRQASLPEGAGLLHIERGDVRLSVPAVSSRVRELPSVRVRTLAVDLVAVRF